MPVNIIRPSAVGNLDTLVLGAGTDKVVAVDSGDPVTHDDATSYLRGENAQTTSYQLTNVPVGIGAVTTYKLGLRANNENESNCGENIYARINTTDAASPAGVAGNGWATSGPNVTARPGGGSWVPSDFVANSNAFQYAGRITGDALAVFPKITTLWGELDYEPSAGGFALFISSVLPPLMALASHAVMKRELVEIYRGRDVRPSNDEDFARILEAFRRRPRFCFLSWLGESRGAYGGI